MARPFQRLGYVASPGTDDSRGTSSAPARKHTAPSDVPALAIRALTGSPLAGSTSEATAAMPNATEPSRFTAAIRHPGDRYPTATHATIDATRKQIDPAASGAQTRAFS